MYLDRSDPDRQAVYALYSDHTYQSFPDTWTESMPQDSCPDIVLQNGLVKPVGSLGKVWCEHPEIQARLPGALSEAQGSLNATWVQPFEYGVIVGDFDYIRLMLFVDGTWQ